MTSITGSGCHPLNKDGVLIFTRKVKEIKHTRSIFCVQCAEIKPSKTELKLPFKISQPPSEMLCCKQRNDRKKKTRKSLLGKQMKLPAPPGCYLVFRRWSFQTTSRVEGVNVNFSPVHHETLDLRFTLWSLKPSVQALFPCPSLLLFIPWFLLFFCTAPVFPPAYLSH